MPLLRFHLLAWSAVLLAITVLSGMTRPEKPVLMAHSPRVAGKPPMIRPYGELPTSFHVVRRVGYYPDSLDPLKRMEQPADLVFKNIRTFKGITARELMGSMEYMESALGVGCNYCHVQGNFASDEKPQKETARSMIHMVNDINQRAFSAPTVTCNTCHHGQPHPDAVPSVHQKEWREIDRTADIDITADTAVTLTIVMEKYIDAIGGNTSVDKVRTRMMKLSQTREQEGMKHGGPGSEEEVRFDCYQTDEGKYFLRTVLNEPNGGRSGGELLRGYDGKIAWAKNGDRSPNRVYNEGYAIIIRSGELFPVSRLRQNSTDVTLLGRASVLDHTYYVVAATGIDNNTERIYFDIATSLVRRRFVKVHTVLGEIPVVISYDDYRKVNGLMIPHTVRWATPLEIWTYRILELQDNVQVDEGRFRMPAP